MLLGGINLARALGLAGIPVIVAGPEPDDPALASRYVIGRCELPPLASREAVVERLLRAAGELDPAMRTRMPLFYGNDDYLGIVQDFRSALATRYALLLNDEPLARALLREPLARSLADELTVQEYIPGDDRSIWSFHGFADERGKLIASFVGRKIRTYPALTGDSSYLELAHDEELATLGRTLVPRIGLKGVFKMDFKRHAASGRFYLLEVNARFNLWHYLGAKGGVNLAQVAYDYVTRGARSAPRQARTRYRWLSPRLDYLAYRSLAARGELSAAGWLASLVSSRKLYDLFAWTDPMPLAVVLWDELKHLSRLRRRVMRWLSTAS